MATKIWLGTNEGNEGDWSVAANWQPSGVPVNGDDVHLRDSAQSVTAGLAQSAVTLASLTVHQSFLGAIGTAAAYLHVGATALTIGRFDGLGPRPAGSRLVKINLGTAASAIDIIDSALRGEGTLPPIMLLCDNANTVLRLRRGIVGIAVNAPGETAELDAAYMDYVDSPQTDAQLIVSEGVTLDSLTKNGGQATVRCSAATVIHREGRMITEGAAAYTLFEQYGGEVTSNATGTIAELKGFGGVFDLLKSSAARTVTAYKPAPNQSHELRYDPAVITVSGIDPQDRVTLRSARA